MPAPPHIIENYFVAPGSKSTSLREQLPQCILLQKKENLCVAEKPSGRRASPSKNFFECYAKQVVFVDQEQCSAIRSQHVRILKRLFKRLWQAKERYVARPRTRRTCHKLTSRYHTASSMFHQRRIPYRCLSVPYADRKRA